MTPGELMAAQASWPEAAVAIAGIALVGVVVVVVIWQALSTARTRITVRRDDAYRELAEEIAEELRAIREQLDRRDGA